MVNDAETAPMERLSRAGALALLLRVMKALTNTLEMIAVVLYYLQQRTNTFCSCSCSATAAARRHRFSMQYAIESADAKGAKFDWCVASEVVAHAWRRLDSF